MGCLWVFGRFALALILLLPSIDSQPALPNSQVSTAWPTAPRGTSIVVSTPAQFQAALNSAQQGDEIVLQAGTSYQGNFYISNTNAGSSWIIVRTSNLAQLPPMGTRVSPSDTSNMPRITAMCGQNFQTLRADTIHHWRFVGLQIDSGSCTRIDGGIITLNNANNIIIDRCYIAGVEGNSIHRGIQLNAQFSAVVDSYIEKITASATAGRDVQAIACWNKCGPLLIQNNFLQAATENIIFGGAVSDDASSNPMDITIRWNVLNKPVSWRGQKYFVKNLFEIKNAQRVLLEGNVLEYNWAEEQAGSAILLTVRSEDGAMPWAAIQDITIRYNIVRHACNGISQSGADGAQVGCCYSNSLQPARILFQDNIFYDMNNPTYCTYPNGVTQEDWRGGRGLGFVDGSAVPAMSAANFVVDHNTIMCTGPFAMSAVTAKADNFQWTNNIVPRAAGCGQCGFAGSGTGEGNAALSAFFNPNYVFTKNGIMTTQPNLAASYPANQYFVAPASMGFTAVPNALTAEPTGSASDMTGWLLLPTSPLYRTASDGRDIGPNITLVQFHINIAITGVTPSPFTTPPPSTAPPPTTPAPTTQPPPPPTTAAPTTAAPTTVPPTTAPPPTPPPTTAAPTPSPTTLPPATTSPSTTQPAPSPTPSPTTPAPSTATPTQPPSTSTTSPQSSAPPMTSTLPSTSTPGQSTSPPLSAPPSTTPPDSSTAPPQTAPPTSTTPPSSSFGTSVPPSSATPQLTTPPANRCKLVLTGNCIDPTPTVNALSQMFGIATSEIATDNCIACPTTTAMCRTLELLLAEGSCVLSDMAAANAGQLNQTLGGTVETAVSKPVNSGSKKPFPWYIPVAVGGGLLLLAVIGVAVYFIVKKASIGGYPAYNSRKEWGSPLDELYNYNQPASF